MSLTNPNTPVSQQDLQDFYHKILPYMGGSSGGGGHTIEDAEGTDLTQRDTLQFGEGFKAEDDDTNKKTVISPDVMQSGDMSDIITPLPTVQPRYQKYSTEEQVVGEWIDGKPIYAKTIADIVLTTNNSWYYPLDDSSGWNMDKMIKLEGFMEDTGSNPIKVPIPYNDGTNHVWCQFNLDRFFLNQTLGSTWKLSITVFYTKITD